MKGCSSEPLMDLNVQPYANGIQHSLSSHPELSPVELLSAGHVSAKAVSSVVAAYLTGYGSSVVVASLASWRDKMVDDVRKRSSKVVRQVTCFFCTDPPGALWGPLRGAFKSKSHVKK